jgi:hypothetical protein
MDSDDARFMSYKQQLSSKSRGTISPDNRAKVAAFLEKYSKSHPEKAKEIRSLLENLKNSL